MLNWTSSNYFCQVSQKCIPHFPSCDRFESSFCKIRSRSRWRWRITTKKVPIVWRKTSIKKLYDREKYFKVFIIYWIDLCKICQKKLKSLFAFAWHSCRNENQKTWIFFDENVKSSILYKKLGGSRFSKFIRSRDLSKKFVTAIENTCAQTLSFIAEVVSIQASWETWCHNTIF